MHPDQPFIAHSWGAALLFYALEQGGGLPALQLLRLALISGALACLVRVARLLGASWGAIILLAPAVLGVVWGRVEVRPQLFSTAFLAVELWLLISVHTGQRSARWLWALPVMFTTWVNLHAGWPTGVAMLLAIMGALAIMHLRTRVLGGEIPSHLPLRHLALVLGACGLALLVNPYGKSLVIFPLEMQAPWIRAQGLEWQGPWRNENWRAVGGGLFAPWIQPLFFTYAAGLAGVLLLTVKRWRTSDPVQMAIMAFWLAMALWHQRASTDAVLLTSPFVAAGLPPGWWRARRWPVLIGSGLMLAVMASALGYTRREQALWAKEVSFFNLDCVAPVVERISPPRRIFTQNFLAHHVLYHLHPRMDVRVNYVWEYVLGPDGHREWAALNRHGPAGLQAYYDQWGANILILPRETWTTGPGPTAFGWAIVHVDDGFFVATREPTPLPVFRVLGPKSEPPVTPENARNILEEAERSLRQCPQRGASAAAAKANALMALGRHAEAQAVAEQAGLTVLPKEP